jgi:hypothetical protein
LFLSFSFLSHNAIGTSASSSQAELEFGSLPVAAGSSSLVDIEPDL